MGRLVTVGNGLSVTVRLPGELRIDAHAASSKVDLSAAVRTLIERGLKSDRDL